MGIVFQKSTLLKPYPKPPHLHKATKIGKFLANKRRKTVNLNLNLDEKDKLLMDRRQAEFDGLIEEARIWMYAVLLPNEVIANGDAEIKKNLDDTFSQLTTMLLGSKIDHDKVNRICGRIARNILVPGLENLDAGSKYYPPRPPKEQVKHLLDDKYVPTEVLCDMYRALHNFKLYDTFQRSYPNAKTWLEVRRGLGEQWLKAGLPKNVLDWFDDEKMRCTFREVGAPIDANTIANDIRERIRSKIYTANLKEVRNLAGPIVDLDLVSVSLGTQPQGIADTFRAGNRVALHPLYYANMAETISLRDQPVVAGKFNLNYTPTAVHILLHEITHVESVLGTMDQYYYYVKGQLEDLGDAYHDGPIQVYQIEHCLSLVRHDYMSNTNRAEDNADSWAMLFTIRMLMLLYPEIDFLAAMQTPDPMNLPVRIVQRRKSLLHHCTLFELLRSREELWNRPDGGIRGPSFGYDHSKDHWSIHSGRKQVRTPKDILEEVMRFAHRQEKKSQKNAEKRVKKELKWQQDLHELRQQKLQVARVRAAAKATAAAALQQRRAKNLKLLANLRETNIKRRRLIDMNKW